jgi:hypothetical protein
MQPAVIISDTSFKMNVISQNKDVVSGLYMMFHCWEEGGEERETGILVPQTGFYKRGNEARLRAYLGFRDGVEPQCCPSGLQR